jgi:hypothetical protein
MGWACGRYGERRGACTVLFGRPKTVWQNNIKMDLKATGWREWFMLGIPL